jgi:hypothetical protein
MLADGAPVEFRQPAGADFILDEEAGLPTSAASAPWRPAAATKSMRSG